MYWNNIIFFILPLICMGCFQPKESPRYINSSRSVQEVLKQQIEKSSPEYSAVTEPETAPLPDEKEVVTENSGADGFNSGVTPDIKETAEDISTDISTEEIFTLREKSPSPDSDTIDLTVLNSDMVYAIIFQMLIEPENFIGKRIKVKGMYYSGFSEFTDREFHYCLIQDALACCAQGIEFEKPVSAGEIPQYSMIVMEGTYSTYTDPRLNNSYYYLKDPVITIIKD